VFIIPHYKKPLACTRVYFVLKSEHFMLLWKAENHDAIHPNENQITRSSP